MTLLNLKNAAIILAWSSFFYAGCQSSDNSEEATVDKVEESASTENNDSEQPAPTLDDIQPAKDVTDAELDNISLAIAGMQKVEQSSQIKLIEAVQASGMEIQRFGQIMQQKQNPDVPVTLSAEEQEVFDKAEASVQTVQASLQSEYEQAITETGLTIERYQSIMIAVQTDTSLQQGIDKRLRP